MKHQDLTPGKTYYLPITIIYTIPEKDLAAILEKHPEKADGEPFPPRARLWDGREVWLSQNVWQHLINPTSIKDLFNQ